MSIETILRNHIQNDLMIYLSTAREHEDNPDSLSVEERVADFYFYMYSMYKPE